MKTPTEKLTELNRDVEREIYGDTEVSRDMAILLLGRAMGIAWELEGHRPLIEVHSFDECPTNWKNLSNNGGDEDWIVVINGERDDLYWVEYLADQLDAGRSPENVTLPDGRAAWICSHA